MKHVVHGTWVAIAILVSLLAVGSAWLGTISMIAAHDENYYLMLRTARFFAVLSAVLTWLSVSSLTTPTVLIIEVALLLVVPLLCAGLDVRSCLFTRHWEERDYWISWTMVLLLPSGAAIGHWLFLTKL